LSTIEVYQTDNVQKYLQKLKRKEQHHIISLDEINDIIKVLDTQLQVMYKETKDEFLGSLMIFYNVLIKIIIYIKSCGRSGEVECFNLDNKIIMFYLESIEILLNEYEKHLLNEVSISHLNYTKSHYLNIINNKIIKYKKISEYTNLLDIIYSLKNGITAFNPTFTLNE
jgi:hypothetical protein